MVAPALSRRWGWPLAALTAAAFLFGLAFHGQRPEPGFVSFKAAGLLSAWSMADVTSVTVTSKGAQKTFRRVPGEGWRSGDSTVAAATAKHLDTGLLLLHNSAPEREMAAEELRERTLAEFGLDPARLSVTLAREGQGSTTVFFGAANPLGLAHYVRIEGKPGIFVLPSFVGQEWQQVVAPS